MLVHIENLVKRYGDLLALDHLSLDIEEGEIFGLLGPNGSGKTTAINCLLALLKYDKGTITIFGKDMKPDSYDIKRDIGVVMQNVAVFEQMSVYENIDYFCGLYIKDKQKRKELVEEAIAFTGLSDFRKMRPKKLSGGLLRRLNIACGIVHKPRLIIMDEPTAALTERETDSLFEVMRKLKAKGVSIIYISHRMEEVFNNCDTITVMRDGQTISSRPTEETNMDQIVGDMVGRVMSEYYPARTNVPGDEVFKVEDFSQPGVFEHISFSVRKGEILGVAGLMGAGRTEIMRAIFGVDPHKEGKLYLSGKEIKIKKPLDAIKLGFGFITENRKTEGLILDFSIKKNIALPSVNALAKSGVINDKEEFGFADTLSHKLGVKTQTIELPASALSGGNQQKVVIAKWVGMHPKLLILDEPTRGIDIGAKKDIYDLMNELTAQGVSIIMVSSELPEVIGMSDRIMVIHEGHLAGIIDHKDATQTRIMTLATGGE